MDDRRRTKNDGRWASSDGKSSRCLWQGELTTVIGPPVCAISRDHGTENSK